MDKNLDHKGRWRSVIVSFRVSPEESVDLNRRVKLSGLNKQDYIISRLSERDIIIQGNPRVHKALRKEMNVIITELKRIENASQLTDELMDTISLISQIYNGMEGDHNGK